MQVWKQKYIHGGVMILKGALTGIANLIPGVSGGTVAYLLGVYFPGLEALHTLITGGKEKKAAFFYLLPLLLGAGLALLAFARLLQWLIEDLSLPLSWFFLGLILGTIPVTLRIASRHVFRVYELLSSLLCFSLAVGIVFFLRPLETSASPLFLGISAAVASIAMAIPGISGSLVLVLFGSYGYFLDALAGPDPVLLGVFSLGALCGLFLFVVLFRSLMRRFSSQTSWGVAGFVLASPVAILSIASDAAMSLRIYLLAAGLAAGLGLYLLTRKS